jgi:hypothetical protein
MRNAIVDQILMERMNRRGGYDGRDYARGDYGRGGYDGRRGRDYGRDYARGGRDGRDGNYDEDDDGPEPSEKLALYYYCIAEDE